MCVTVDRRRLVLSVNALNGFSRSWIVVAPHMLWSPVWLSYCTLWLFMTPSTHFPLDYCVSFTWQNGGWVFLWLYLCRKTATVISVHLLSAGSTSVAIHVLSSGVLDHWAWVELTFVTQFKCTFISGLPIKHSLKFCGFNRCHLTLKPFRVGENDPS